MNRRFRCSVASLASLVTCLACNQPPAAAQTAQFTPLGFLPGGPSTYATGVSADGGVVVGQSINSGTGAFRWTQAGGMQSLLITTGGGLASGAAAVSADGTVVNGYRTSIGGSDQACKWNAAGQMSLLPFTTGGLSSASYGISADGSTITGWCLATNQEAIRWTPTGAQNLGDLPGGTVNSGANGASADGSVIVGYGRSASGTEAFRWTQASGMVGLGRLPGAATSGASGISGDGAIVVGASPQLNERAFLWTAQTGMVDLQAYLVAYGATGLSGWTLRTASAISLNGTHVVGTGIDPTGFSQAWRATLPQCTADLNGNGDVSIDDLAILLAHFGIPQGARPTDGDLNADGDVDLNDLATMLALFGTIC